MAQTVNSNNSQSSAAAEENQLIAEAVSKAEQILNDGKGFDNRYADDADYISYDVDRSAKKEDADKYSKDLSFYDPTKDFEETVNLLRNKRSTFLPYDLVNQADAYSGGEDKIGLIASDDLSIIEPAINTFMRLIGLPRHDCDQIRNDISYRLTEFEGVPEKYKDKNKKIEDFLFDRFTYDIDKFREVVSVGLVLPEERAKELNILDCLKKIKKDDYRSLFMIPVQDGRIADCINEPDKIVAQPFTDRFRRTINSKDIKPSLLEAIIRIRLDRFSGTSNAQTPGTTDPAEVFAVDQTDLDRYGILESLFILRLNAALGGLNNCMYTAMENIYEKATFDLKRKAESTPKTAEAPDATTAEDSNPEETSADEARSQEIDKNASYAQLGDSKYFVGCTDKKSADGSGEEGDNGNIKGETEDGGKGEDTSVVALRNQITVEDAILTILGDRGEVAIDYEKGTVRKTSIHDAYLISSALSIIRAPTNAKKQRLKEKEKPEAKGSGTITEYTKGGSYDISSVRITLPPDAEPDFKLIKTIIGADIGVGAIDVAAFTIALFAIPEDYLLGLLTNKQIENMLYGDFKGILPPTYAKEGFRKDMLESLIELSRYINDAYSVFFKEES